MSTPTDTTTDEPELPAIGSVWDARDGRRMRVEEWTRPVFYPADDYWARMTVLNPAPRMRRATTMSLKHFGGFLKPVAAGSEWKLPDVVPEVVGTKS